MLERACRPLDGLLLAALVVSCGGEGPATATDGSESTATGDAMTSSGGSGSTSAMATSDPSTTESLDESSGGASDGTPGCGLSTSPGETALELELDGVTRSAILVVPDGYDPELPTPLVYAFHGLGSTADVARLYFGVEQAADGQAIFVYPQGLPLGSEGGLTGWDLASTGIDMAFFDAMHEALTSSLCIDPDRVFATGHSFGGYMSNALGCFRAGVLRAIGPVAGGPPLEGCEDETVAAWLAHGEMDGIVPFFLGELARDSLLERNGCGTQTATVEPAPCVAYDGCESDVPVVWCAHQETELSGHMWPRFAGTAIWEFFASLPPKG
ncbi:alpha/beta hydrolase family esterase [Paraliomyxa miuraensis]|uniref:alpha/beta hydrolase family esterase n=1 Tax=Paraliomyxa miuraensis TaxID=376150 RepID=UPI002257F0B7|nr:prolyl oligopeptidase family serine peptidase [Paraliomyxa miuraensis]MCX4242748.1 prolyl oligopeptidase family serine peptidase [Paraliomyxa miuraensis]